MNGANEFLANLASHYRNQFQEQKVILSFQAFLDLVKANPKNMIRSSSEYLRDTFDHFGKREIKDGKNKLERFKLFDQGTQKCPSIIGGESVQDEIYKILQTFCRQGISNKLILLHGPNGSAKTSTIEAIANGMSKYSETDEGAVYSFNWIFPTDRSATPSVSGEAGPIGFSKPSSSEQDYGKSFAHLEDAKIASKINSEFHDNPIFLIPMPQREIWLKRWIADQEGISPEDVIIPQHLQLPGLSKKNQLILENLLAAYEGDLGQVLCHIQVERFFYSKQYRVGISTVEPQMHLDATEKQLTMDKNVANLPSVLHNIRFYEAHGELIESNRGLLEFSDLLKRPLEAFKYLLTTVEKSSINLPSSNQNLDLVFFATTNEKHLDTFKTIPDFSSFRGRFEMVTVPYLLKASEEVKIYESDIESLKALTKITPHSLKLLCTWAVMTRLKQPDPEKYENKVRSLIARLDPRNKLRIYEGELLKGNFKPAEEGTFKDLRNAIINESVGMVVYEGRFGASPREIRGILQRAAQNRNHETLTPMAVFDELDRIVKDRTVYEFLQFEPRGKYHDATHFIKIIKDEFCDIFEREVLLSMGMVDETQYDQLLARYIDNIVAFVKNEKLYNPTTESYETPSSTVMQEVEKILNIQGPADRYRQSLIAKIAAYKIENPEATVRVSEVFEDLLHKLQDHYFGERKKVVEEIYQSMLSLERDDERNLTDDNIEKALNTYKELERRYGYDRHSARECLKFMITHTKTVT